MVNKSINAIDAFIHYLSLKKNDFSLERNNFSIRPLQFNYLSYELFLEKKILSDSKKKEKKSSLVSYGRKWFRTFLSDSKKKKSASFKNILCKCDSINCSRASDLRRCTSHPSGCRD